MNAAVVASRKKPAPRTKPSAKPARKPAAQAAATAADVDVAVIGAGFSGLCMAIAIWSYLRGCAGKYGVLPHMRFGTEVASAEFDGAKGWWTVRTVAGDTLTARMVVSGIGALSIPAYPKMPGHRKVQGHDLSFGPLES